MIKVAEKRRENFLYSSSDRSVCRFLLLGIPPSAIKRGSISAARPSIPCFTNQVICLKKIYISPFAQNWTELHATVEICSAFKGNFQISKLLHLMFFYRTEIREFLMRDRETLVLKKLLIILCFTLRWQPEMVESPKTVLR